MNLSPKLSKVTTPRQRATSAVVWSLDAPGRREKTTAMDFIPADVASMSFQRPATSESSRVTMPVITSPRKQSAKMPRSASASMPPSPHRNHQSSVRVSHSAQVIGRGGLQSPKMLQPVGYHETQPHPTTQSLAMRRNLSRQSTKSTPDIGSQIESTKVQMERMLTMNRFDSPSAPTVTLGAMDSFAEQLLDEHTIYQETFRTLLQQIDPEHATLLRSIRNHYRVMFERVPRQIKTLHLELTQSQQLNTTLENEISRVKANIRNICKELDALLQERKSNIANSATPNLHFNEAVTSSESATTTVKQLQRLYDLQRARLEAQLQSTEHTSNTWMELAQKISQCVCEPRALAALKKISLCSHSWAKMAEKLMTSVMERDNNLVNRVEQHLAMWRTLSATMIRRVKKVEENGVECLTELCTQILGHQTLLTRDRDGNRRLHMVEKTEIRVRGWVALVQQRLLFFERTDPGPAEQLDALCTSWSELAHTLVDSHPNLNKAIISDMYEVNVTGGEWVDKIIKPASDDANMIISYLKVLKTVLSQWQQKADEQNAGLRRTEISIDVWKDFLDGFEVLCDKCVTTCSIDTAKQKHDVDAIDTKRWSTLSGTWVLRLQREIGVVTKTLDAQIQQAVNLYQEWEVLVYLCSANFTEAHPDIVEGKHQRVWAIVDNLTSAIVDCAAANMVVHPPAPTLLQTLKNTHQRIHKSIDAFDDDGDDDDDNNNNDKCDDGDDDSTTEDFVATLIEGVMCSDDLVVVRDDAVDWHEQACVVMRRLRQDYKSPRLTVNNTTNNNNNSSSNNDSNNKKETESMKREDGKVITTLEDGNLHQFTLPTDDEVTKLLADSRSPTIVSQATSRNVELCSKLMVRADERLRELRLLVHSKLKEFMPSDEYDALSIPQTLTD